MGNVATDVDWHHCRENRDQSLRASTCADHGTAQDTLCLIQTKAEWSGRPQELVERTIAPGTRQRLGAFRPVCVEPAPAYRRVLREKAEAANCDDLDMRKRFWSFWNGHVRPWLDRLPPHVRIAPELGWLTSKWEATFPEMPPIGHLVRGDERWVRFHSLPESKRYAENEAEYEELLRRHHKVLATLSGPEPDLIAITAAWSPTKYPRPRPHALERAAPRAGLWQSIVLEPHEEDAWFTNLFVSKVANNPASLNPLLRLVADFGTADVLLTTPELNWLYHPYDGGADVIASSVEQRDLIRQQFADWLPANSSGL